ncbi:MAG TPA: Uma2 family endonuclease [Chthoniobacteraceae bacterium]|jgi:Uma2 family endonuclease|nr:Uma2 family endonuclease [Chthoniobacteraceae bacterium]
MTALLNDELYLTPEEYLELEEGNEVRHEYSNGYVEAMAGSTWEHNIIVLNILTELTNRLANKPCVPLGMDRRLRIRRPESTFYYYPDVIVDCSGNKSLEAVDPTVIFEILSPRTRRKDQGEKLLNYLNLASTRVYVLVDQRRVHLTVHRRGADGQWGLEAITDLDAALALPEVGCTLPLRTIYARLSLTEEP